ncbi:MAG: sodium:solute symporter family protein [Patescibacteria group bacterium]|nr:sodium:solute symporter family protein [Patescibacteria group bacterium]
MLVVLGLGFYLSKKEGAEGYFVNNRNTTLFFLIFTALSTSVGAGTVLGVASASFQTGISFGVLFMIASALGWALMGYLAPRIKKFGDEQKAYTFGDYLAYQYSDRARKIGRLVVLIAYFFGTGIQFVAFAQLINVTTNLSFTPALLIVALITILYTALAGVKGDFYTDALQFFVMFPVFIFLFIKGFALVGIKELLILPEGFFNLYNYNGPIFFWAGVLLGFPLILTSVDAWQRVFAATDERTAKIAFYWSGILKVGVIGAAILVGLLAYHIVPNADADGAMFALMAEILPSGLLGLGLASVLAIIMSTVDTGIMVGSATITKDFFLAKYKNASEEEVLRVGKISASLFGLVGLAIAYFVQDIVTLAIVSVQVLIIFAPALLGGLVWKVKNEKSAYWSILLGFLATLIVLPINVNFAFIPGLLISIIAYVVPIFKEKRLARI